MAEYDDEVLRKQIEEAVKADKDLTSGEDLHFPESFRRIWRNLLAPWNRR